MRTVKQSSVVRETENGEEGEEEAAEFGEEDLFHQQVEAPGWLTWTHARCTRARLPARSPRAARQLLGHRPGLPRQPTPGRTARRRRWPVGDYPRLLAVAPVWTSGLWPGALRSGVLNPKYLQAAPV